MDHNYSQSSISKPIDPRLTMVVERMFQKCLADKEYKMAIGIALESRRLDIVEKALDGCVKTNGDVVSKDSMMKEDSAGKSKDPGALLLKYTMEVVIDLVQSVDFRNKV